MSAGGLAWAVEALIASSLLMGFVLLVRGPAQRALGPQLAYWLWALPVLRMVTPPLPAAWRESAAAPISAASETVMIFLADAPAATGGTAAAAGVPWLLVGTILWVGGAVAFFAWHGLAHADYVRRILSPPATRARLDDGTTLVESAAAVGPVAFGVFRRFVAVPRDFAERYDADERRLALAHELGHHARGDLIANWVGLAMLAVHWFNPLAWVAYRKFRADQEMANDARVLAALPPLERHAYACAIVKAAHGRAVTAACHLHTIEDLKGRLRMLKASRKSRRVLMAGATGIAGLTVMGLGLTASGAAAERIAATAATQVPMLAAHVAAVPVPPSTVAPPAPPAPAADAPTVGKRVVVVNRDGRTERFEGEAADAYLASRPELSKYTDGSHVRALKDKLADREMVLIRRDKRLSELEPALRLKLKEVEGLRFTAPPLPPMPPVPPVALGAIAPDVRVFVSPGKHHTHIERRVRTEKDGKAHALAMMPRVIDGDCGDRQKESFTVRDQDKDGRLRIVICRTRIADFADGRARLGHLRALEGLNHGRRAIEANRDLSAEERAQALAGIDRARTSIERQMKDATAPK